MRTRTKTPAIAVEKTPAAPAPAPVAPVDTSDSERISLAWFADKNGKIEWDRMADKTKERLRGIMTSPDARKALGIVQDPVQQAQFFPPAFVNTMYDALGMIETAVATRWVGIDPDIAKRVMLYNDAEKAMLNPPTCAVLNQYLGDFEHKNLAALLMLLTGLTLQKIAALRQLMIQLKGTHTPENPPPTKEDKSKNGEAPIYRDITLSQEDIALAAEYAMHDMSKVA